MGWTESNENNWLRNLNKNLKKKIEGVENRKPNLKCKKSKWTWHNQTHPKWSNKTG